MKFVHKSYNALSRQGILTSRHVAVLLGRNANSDDMLQLLVSRGVDVTVVSTIGDFDQSLGRNAFDNDDVRLVASELSEYLNCHVAPGKDSVIISSEDMYTVLLVFSTPQLQSRFSTQKVQWELVRQCADKIEFSALCKRLQIDTPETFVLKSEEDFAKVSKQIPYPGIVKPHHHGAVPKRIIPKVLEISNEQELASLADKVWAFGQPLLYQDLVPGDSEMTWFVGGLFGASCDVSNVFVGQKLLEYPLGTTTYARLSWNEDVLNIARKFVHDVGYQGLVDIEVKFDVRDQKYKMLEVNPRIGRWHSISDTGQIDVISVFYSEKAGIELQATDLHADKRTWIDPHRALCRFIERWGLAVGFFRWFLAMCCADIKAGDGLRSGRRIVHQIRIVLGHVKELGMKVALFGTRRSTYLKTGRRMSNIKADIATAADLQDLTETARLSRSR